MKRSIRRQLVRRAGFTLVELVLAAGLLSILIVAVFALIDGSLSIWSRSETRRNLTEQATGVAELLAHDLRSLEGGVRGDLLVEWVTFDTDGDEINEMTWPRLRFVRQASAVEIARMLASSPEEPAEAEEADETTSPANEADAVAAEEEFADQRKQPGFSGPALIEVCWAVVPINMQAPDERAEGLIYRGTRRVSDGGDSYFDKSFVKGGGRVHVEELDEVSGGLLWFQPLLATQTSIIHDGWEIGIEEPDSATSWDAWNSDRPDSTIHSWNQPNGGMPRVTDRPLLPRRIRIEFEFERPVDRLRRSRTRTQIELTDAAFDVSDGSRLPQPGAHIKVDGEWMLVTNVRTDRVTVKRGQRGTTIMIHDVGSMVHWGMPLVREIPVALYKEDWNL